MKEPAISLLFSSLNGAERLPGLLDSLIQTEKPLGGFEIIAVDNASTDATSDVLESRAEELPLTVLYEPRAGKNVALNQALSVAKGKLIVFTDDDVLLPRNFFTAYQNVASRESQFALFGGHIVPEWGAPPDVRILNEVPLNTAYAITETDRCEGLIAANRLYGPNMAVRRAVFDSGLSFDESIGPNGGRYVMGDETDLLIRAEAANFPAFFIPQITVQHRVRKEQLDISWIERRAFIAGSSLVHNQLRKRGGRLPENAMLAGIPRWAARKLFTAEAGVFFQRLRVSQIGPYKARWERGFARGYASEYRHIRQSGNNTETETRAHV